MPTFSVEVLPGATYEVDAPDEATAWKWAKYTHLQGAGANTPAASHTTSASQADTTPKSKPMAPEWGQRNPELYGVVGAARETLGPLVEAGLGTAGGILGMRAGPLGGVAGSAGGYAAGKQATNLLDLALNNVEPQSYGNNALRIGGDVSEGAISTMLPSVAGKVAAPFVAGARTAGNWVGNFMLSPKDRAAKIAGEAFAETPGLADVLRANPDALASRALTQGGSFAPGPQALLRAVTATNLGATTYTANTLRNQTMQDVNVLAQLAHGDSQTAARAARDAMKDALKTRLLPELETELAAANTAGAMLPGLQAKAAKLGEGAAAKVEDVRRFTAAAGRAPEVAGGIPLQGPWGAAPRISGRYGYVGDLAEKATAVADQAAADSLALGAGRRSAQYIADSLAAHGLKPLKAESVIAAVDRKLTDPTYAGNPDIEHAAAVIKDALAKWTDANGVVSAEALDSIRKNAVNALIQRMSPSMDAKSQKAAAVSALEAFKPAFISAIEDAGGTGYGAYLNAYSSGMQEIARKKLGAEMLKLYSTSPDKFVSVVNGNDPKMIEKILGPRKYDIAEEVAPDVYAQWKGMADRLAQAKSATEQADIGATAVQSIVKANEPKLRIPWGLSSKVAVMNRGLAGIEGVMDARTMAILAEGAKSGANMARLLDRVPAPQRAALVSVAQAKFPNMSAASAVMSLLSGQDMYDRNVDVVTQGPSFAANWLAPRNQNALSQ